MKRLKNVPHLEITMGSTFVVPGVINSIKKIKAFQQGRKNVIKDIIKVTRSLENRNILLKGTTWKITS